MLEVWPHYKVIQLSGMAELREMFREDTRFELNWLLCSTSGVHGSYDTLDDVESCMDGRGEYCQDEEHQHANSITVLVIQPRLVCLRYGDVAITREDIPFLRGAVALSLGAIEASQDGNGLR